MITDFGLVPRYTTQLLPLALRKRMKKRSLYIRVMAGCIHPLVSSCSCGTVPLNCAQAKKLKILRIIRDTGFFAIYPPEPQDSLPTLFSDIPSIGYYWLESPSLHKAASSLVVKAGPSLSPKPYDPRW